MKKRYKVFACEVLFRELSFEAAQSANTIDLVFNRYGLHHVGSEKMVAEIQQMVDSVADETPYDAILFGYALCNNGLAGLKSREIPLVIPRAHDCITLLLGSKEEYAVEFGREPGTYYRSPGWLEHLSDDMTDSGYVQMGFTLGYDEMVKKYGEENAKYLMEAMGGLGSFKQNYTRIAYIDTGLGPRDDLIETSRKEAEDNGWKLDVLKGSRRLLKNMVEGTWDEQDFLVVQPGQTVAPSHDDLIIKAV